MLIKLGQNLFKILLSQTTLMKTSAFIPLHELVPHFQKSRTAEPKIAKNIPQKAFEKAFDAVHDFKIVDFRNFFEQPLQ